MTSLIKNGIAAGIFCLCASAKADLPGEFPNCAVDKNGPNCSLQPNLTYGLICCRNTGCTIETQRVQRSNACQDKL